MFGDGEETSLEPLFTNGCIANTIDSDVLERTYKVMQSTHSTSTKDD